MRSRWLFLIPAALLLSSSCAATSGALPNPTPSPTPSATTAVDYGLPPAGVPLLYVHDPREPGWLLGFDWTGRPRATVKPASAPGVVESAPDGSMFVSPDGTYLDRLGRPMIGPPAPAQKGNPGGLWADDGRHLCFVELDQQTFVWTLSTQVPGEAVRSIATIAQDQGIGQSGIRAVACSYRNDVAVLVGDSIAWESDVWVVRLSDGRVIAHHTYPYDPNARVRSNMVGTRDGTYVAENRDSGTTIRRVADWSVAGSLPRPYEALNFSADGSVVLAVKAPWRQPGAQLAVIDWSTGRQVWTLDSPIQSVYRWTSAPEAAAFAIALRSAPLLNEILIVGGDGSTSVIPGRYEPVW